VVIPGRRFTEPGDLTISFAGVLASDGTVTFTTTVPPALSVRVMVAVPAPTPRMVKFVLERVTFATF
jgi:hypothetical protein